MRTIGKIQVLLLGVFLFLNSCREPNSPGTEIFQEGNTLPADRWNSASSYTVLKSQAEVDAFPCNIEILNSNLVLGDMSGSDISDLSSLGCIIRVNGFVQVVGTRLRDFSGLRLRSIRSGLQILHNPLLINLQGLNQLDSLGGSLLISSNDAFQDFRGINALNHLDALEVYENNQLKNLSGLEHVESIGNEADWFVNLHFASNASLESLDGLRALRRVRGGIWITGQPKLTSIDLLKKIERNGGSLFIQNNGGK